MWPRTGLADGGVVWHRGQRSGAWGVTATGSQEGGTGGGDPVLPPTLHFLASLPQHVPPPGVCPQSSTKSKGLSRKPRSGGDGGGGVD